MMREYHIERGDRQSYPGGCLVVTQQVHVDDLVPRELPPDVFIAEERRGDGVIIDPLEDADDGRPVAWMEIIVA